MPNLQGSCHCGQITVEFSTAMEPAAFSPRACQCSFCRRHSSATIADPAGLLTLATVDQNVYRFGLAITDFHVCARCGVFVAATWKDQGGGVYGVVNIHTLANERQFTVAPIEADFDGEDVSAREARRQTNWTPVRFWASTDCYPQKVDEADTVSIGGQRSFILMRSDIELSRAARIRSFSTAYSAASP